jgi:MFS family permease
VALLRAVPESDLWRAPGRGPILRALARRDVLGTFGRCFVLTILNMSNYWFAVSWLPRYLQVERGLSLARSGWSTLAFVAGSLSGYLLFGVLSDRWGRRSAFTLFCGLMAGGLVMFTLFWQAIAAHPGLVLLFMFVAGVGTGTWSSYGPMMSELFPTTVRGTAMSVIMNATRGVQFVAPVVIAAVAPRWGMGGGIALAAGFAVAAGLWIWTLPETRGRHLAAANPA